MKRICISPAAQLVAGAAIVAGTGALVASQLPDIRRYMKIRSM